MTVLKKILQQLLGQKINLKPPPKLCFQGGVFLPGFLQLTWWNCPCSISACSPAWVIMGGWQHRPLEAQAYLPISRNGHFTATLYHWELGLTYLTWREFLQTLYQLLLPVFLLLGSRASGLAKVPYERRTHYNANTLEHNSCLCAAILQLKQGSSGLSYVISDMISSFYTRKCIISHLLSVVPTFLASGLVLWKTIFPCTRVGGMVSAWVKCITLGLEVGDSCVKSPREPCEAEGKQKHHSSWSLRVLIPSS